MTLVMIVVMIESTGMFLALGDMTGTQDRRSAALAAGLRTDGLGTVIGGVFNTFPYTSFSQNVGLVGVTGVSARFVCVAGGVILIVLGPDAQDGGAGRGAADGRAGRRRARDVRHGRGHRHPHPLPASTSRPTATTSSSSASRSASGMIPLVAPDFKMWLPHAIHPLIESGILLTSIGAVLLNVFFNGAKGSAEDLREAAMADSGH